MSGIPYLCVAVRSMDSRKPIIDESTLAAFMAGTLPPRQRREVAARLAEDPRMREVLSMAMRALDAAQEEVPVGVPDVVRPPVPLRRMETPAPAEARRPRRLRLLRFGRYVAAAVVVAVVGLGVWRAFAPSSPTEPVRTLRGEEAGPLTLTLPASLDALDLAWEAVPGADHYEVVVWDLEAAETVARFQVETHRIGAETPIARTLQALLEAGRPYAVRVDALDAANRLLRSSGMVTFELQR